MDWISLISVLVLPMLEKCRAKTSSEDPQAVLRQAYDAATNTMDPQLVEDAIPQVRRAAHKARQRASKADRKTFPRYSYQDFYDMAEKNLIDAMNAPPEKVAAIQATVASLGDDE